MIESIHWACSSPAVASIRSSSALPRITDNGPRISCTIPVSSRPTWASCWLSIASPDICRNSISRRTRPRMIAPAESFAT